MGCAFSKRKRLERESSISFVGFDHIGSEIDILFDTWDQFAKSCENIIIKAAHWAKVFKTKKDDGLDLESIIKFRALANLSTETSVVTYPYMSAIRHLKPTLLQILAILEELERCKSKIKSYELMKSRNASKGKVVPELVDESPNNEELQNHETSIRNCSSRLLELINLELKQNLHSLICEDHIMSKAERFLFSEATGISELITENSVTQNSAKPDTITKQKAILERSVNLLEGWLLYSNRANESLRKLQSAEETLYVKLQNLVNYFSSKEASLNRLPAARAGETIVQMVNSMVFYVKANNVGRASHKLEQKLEDQIQALENAKSTYLLLLDDIKEFEQDPIGAKKLKEAIINEAFEYGPLRTHQITRAQKGIITGINEYFSSREIQLSAMILGFPQSVQGELHQFELKITKDKPQLAWTENQALYHFSPRTQDASIPSISISSIAAESLEDVKAESMDKLHPRDSRALHSTSGERSKVLKIS